MAKTTKKTKKSSAPSAREKAEEAEVANNPGSAEDQPEETTTAVGTVEQLDEEMQARYEKVKRGELHITDLQKMTVAELHTIAKEEGLAEYTGLKTHGTSVFPVPLT